MGGIKRLALIEKPKKQKRLDPNKVYLVWHRFGGGCYELRRESDGAEVHCLARIDQETIFEPKGWKYWVFHPSNYEQMQSGMAGTLAATAMLAEAAVKTPTWWRGKSISVDCRAFK